MKPQIKSALAKCGTSALCLLTIAVGSVFLYDLDTVVFYVSVAALAAVAVSYCAIDGGKYPHASRTVLVAAVVACIFVALYIVYFETGLNEKFNDFDAIKSLILDSGFWGVAVFIALTVFQVVVLPVPAALTIVLGTAIYGPTLSFILSTVGTMIGSLISFMLGKVFGRRLCDWMFGAEKTEKYARLLNEKGRFLFIIILLFPMFPDDMMCMIAGITTMSYGYFTLVCLLTRPIMIGITAYLGSGMIPFEGWGIPVWIAIVCAMFVALVLAYCIKSRIESRGAGKVKERKKRTK